MDITKKIPLYGEIIKDGSPLNVMTPENVSELYEYDLNIHKIKGFWRVVPD